MWSKSPHPAMIFHMALQSFIPLIFCQNDLPNVLFIVIDDLRTTLGAYNDTYALTPNIDHIADNGITFMNAFSQQALCGPSRTSFLTSRRPDSLKLIDVHYYWRNHAGNFTSLPQYFKQSGYVTQSAGKVFHPGIVSNHNDDQPFSWSRKPFHPSSHKYKNWPVCLNKDGHLSSNIYCPIKLEDQPEKTLPDIQTTEFALKWLRKNAYHRRKKTTKCIKENLAHQCNVKPFFLAVGFHKPHIPLKFPEEFLELFPISSVRLPTNRFRPAGLPPVAWNPWNDLRRREDISHLNLSFPYGPISDDYSKYLRQGYYSSVSYVDSLIGILVSKAKRLFPNTITVLIGDHGWSLGEHEEWSKFSNYEVATKVPFIVSLPSAKLFQNKHFLLAKKEMKMDVIKKNYFKKYVAFYRDKKLNKSPNGKRYKGLAELLDVFPTIVDLAGLPELPKCLLNGLTSSETCTEGVSHACTINKYLSRHSANPQNYEKLKKCPSKNAALSQYPRPDPIPSIHPDSDQPRLTETKIMGYSLRESRFRYTRWCEFDSKSFSANCDKTIAEELYDHFNDEGENRNIVHMQTKTVERLRKLLKASMSGD